MICSTEVHLGKSEVSISRNDSEHHRKAFLKRCPNAYLIKERRARGRSSGREERFLNLFFFSGCSGNPN